MELSISQIANLTGKDRHTVAIRMAGLSFKEGKKRAKLYDSAEALAAIYESESLEAARAKQALSQAALNEIREQELRKTRIPIQIVRDRESCRRETAHAGNHQRLIRQVALHPGAIEMVIYRRNPPFCCCNG